MINGDLIADKQNNPNHSLPSFRAIRARDEAHLMTQRLFIAAIMMDDQVDVGPAQN